MGFIGKDSDSKFDWAKEGVIGRTKKKKTDRNITNIKP
jgi:hypothetical protein